MERSPAKNAVAGTKETLHYLSAARIGHLPVTFNSPHALSNEPERQERFWIADVFTTKALPIPLFKKTQ